jgi:hypothetical protein
MNTIKITAICSTCGAKVYPENIATCWRCGESLFNEICSTCGGNGCTSCALTGKAPSFIIKFGGRRDD